jgi:hypothetical protein
MVQQNIGYWDEYYHVVDVNNDIFNKIPNSMCISGTTDVVKYLCGNQEEFDLLTSIGLKIDRSVDWYKIQLVY